MPEAKKSEAKKLYLLILLLIPHYHLWAETNMAEKNEAEKSDIKPEIVRENYAASTAKLNIDTAKTVIANYYNNNGVWAGVFKIDSIKDLRIKYHGKRRAVIHVVYSYTPIVRKKFQPQGTDQRTFTLVKHSQDWSVISMGMHKSARF